MLLTRVAFEARDPNWRSRVERIFADAAFVQDVGVTLEDFGPGWVEAGLKLEARHLQQDGVAHAAVHTLIADHAAGAAAGSLQAPDQVVLSIGLELKLLRAAMGERLSCRAEVIKAGRSISVAESSVYVHAGEAPPKLVSKASITFTHVAAERVAGKSA